MDIKLMIDDINEELIGIRRDFHMNPELSGYEYRTMNKICEYLDSWGIEYKKGVAKTGVAAIIRGRKSGRTVAIRADIDALPLKEEKSPVYKSIKEGVMHACGHDAHTAIALGTAKILKQMELNLKGNVKFLFQPAEETTGGAKRMIDEGCLKNPDVDYIIGLHVDTTVDTGKITVKYGKMMAASDEITIIAKGKSTHGAHPDEGIDPILISSNLMMSLQSIISRNISPFNPVVFTIGSIHGGTKGNIIPDEVVMNGILRTLDENTRVFAKKRIESIVENVSISLGGEGKVIIRESYGPLINDDEAVDVVRNAAEEILNKENVIVSDIPNMGTEDFSYFSKSVKSCFYNLGSRNEKKDAIYPLHSSHFDIDEDCLKIGVEIHIKSVIHLLNK